VRSKSWPALPAGSAVHKWPSFIGARTITFGPSRLIATRTPASTSAQDHVYRPELRYAKTLREALMEVYGYLQKLQAHEVRWWDMSSSQNRPVWYQGTAATIVGFTPESGQAYLQPVEGEMFPPLAVAREVIGDASARTSVAVDILNPEVIWTRRAEVRPPEPPQEQEEAPTVRWGPARASLLEFFGAGDTAERDRLARRCAASGAHLRRAARPAHRRPRIGL